MATKRHLVNLGLKSASGEGNYSDNDIIHMFTIRLLRGQSAAPACGRPVLTAPPSTPLVPPLPSSDLDLDSVHVHTDTFGHTSRLLPPPLSKSVPFFKILLGFTSAAHSWLSWSPLVLKSGICATSATYYAALSRLQREAQL